MKRRLLHHENNNVGNLFASEWLLSRVQCPRTLSDSPQELVQQVTAIAMMTSTGSLSAEAATAAAAATTTTTATLVFASTCCNGADLQSSSGPNWRSLFLANLSPEHQTQKQQQQQQLQVAQVRQN